MRSTLVVVMLLTSAFAALPAAAADPAPGASATPAAAPAPPPEPPKFDASDPRVAIIDSIGRLENQRDPKCYATASRLEDFMYGTPLTEEARFAKVELQKALLRHLWAAASQAATARGQADLDAAAIQPFVDQALIFSTTDKGDWNLRTARGEALTIAERDKRQYGNVAYALRAILAVQQDALLDSGSALLPLRPDAVAKLKDLIDLLALAALERGDRAARAAGQAEIDAPTFRTAWVSLTPEATAATETGGAATTAAASSRSAAPATASSAERFPTVREIASQKLAAYAAYNNIAMPVFLRNIQVYFARHRWPSDAEEGKAFKDYFTEAMIQWTRDVLLEADKQARAAGHPLIRIEDVHTAIERFLPYEQNQFEDITYFPRLPRGERVTIEAYDLDAFRDPGVHWVYLSEALFDPKYPGTVEPDPFAAELLVEGVAQFAVLTLRLAGQQADAAGDARLKVAHVEQSLQRIQTLLDKNTAAPTPTAASDTVASSPDTKQLPGAYFTDVTTSTGIAFAHRNSDWLARLIRSYTVQQDGAAKLAIPPAFGGSGVAAEDVDGDGDVDVLLLSGAGNKLYLNDGKGRYSDVTAAAGLDWRRPDGRPGEPRQPIIADFDNDGREDIFITYVDDDNRLYRNAGMQGGVPRFADVTAAAGLGGKGLVAGPATAADFDGDGLLDVFVGYFGDYPRGVMPTLSRRNANALPDKIFRNLGGMRFEDRSPGSGVENTGWAQAVGHADFDRDGKQDLIVGNDFGVNAYYRNRGDWKFEDMAPALGTDRPSYTMNVGMTDLNRDGFPEVYISNIVTMNKDEKYVLPDANTPMKFDLKKLATMRVVESNDLWESVAQNGRLQSYALSQAVGRGKNSTGWSWDADFFDFDNDGDDDLYVLDGMNEYAVYSSAGAYFSDDSGERKDVVIPVDARERNVFFENRDGKLEEQSEASGADLLGNSRSAAYLDLDGDGDLDMVLNDFVGAAVVYRNNAERLKRHWLKVQLVGDPAQGSTRDAIGAHLTLDSAHSKNLWREVYSTTGYLSGHPKEQHFGLDQDRKADLTVQWPNGRSETFRGLAADRRYRIVQGKAPEVVR